ncbi:MAG TPA: right-handed parallel beta-helix repeat-containing protein [Chitinophagaceae bacterium]|nr:right-handed parallel beta-helix repeat-containing protein [Chitinophagaceae bacterium]
MKKLYPCLAALLFFYSSFGQFPAPYCAEQFPGGTRPVTRVTFHTLDNTSAANGTAPHEDFTALSTQVFAGSTYTLSVQCNTGSGERGFLYAYFDWNGDGTLDNGEERYVINAVSGSNGSDGKTATGEIDIPWRIREGPVRMRVVHQLAPDFHSVCNTTGKGQAEDYTLQLAYPRPNVVYVRSGNNGLDNGSSWSNAFSSLRRALETALPRDTIKVAAGMYPVGTQQGSSFTLKEGQVLLGGYPATGNPTDAQRDFGRRQTILTGNGAAQVLRLVQVSEATRVDGFIIQDGAAGYADNLPEATVGGGLMMWNSQALVRNCVFRSNGANDGGAAVSLKGSQPRFEHCFFVDNGSLNPLSTVLAVSSTSSFTNCVFARNSGNTVQVREGNLSLRHCTFVSNQLYDRHDLPYSLSAENAQVTVTNSIFFRNRRSLRSEDPDFHTVQSSFTLQRTITDVSEGPDAVLVGVLPKFRDTASIAGADGYYFTSDDGLQLLNPCSPALNAGMTIAGGPATDINGRLRLVSTAPDLGAYEVQEAPRLQPKSLYVNKAATGTNDGSSWQNAFTDLRRAFDACSDTIHIAAGTYYLPEGDPAAAYWLENRRVVLAGYSATGNPGPGSRNPVLHPTLLSARAPGPQAISGRVLIRGKKIDSTAVVDGLTFQDIGTGSFSLGEIHSTAVYLSESAHPLFRNCVFRNNVGGPGGALIVWNGSRPVFRDCRFENNTGAGDDHHWGSAVYNYQSAPRFYGCTFRGNSNATGGIIGFYGGAVYNDSAHPYFDSCTFSGNTGYQGGGAIASFRGSRPVIVRSLFEGNRAADIGRGFGGDLYNHASFPEVHASRFINSKAWHGGSVANFGGSVVLFDHCTFQGGKGEANGGAVYSDGAESVFRSCVFTKNKANRGGALYSEQNSRLRIQNCLLTDNAGTGGTALMAWSSTQVEILQSTFMRHTSSPGDYGYPVIATSRGSQLTIRNTVFTRNDFDTAGPFSGELQNYNGQIDIKNSVTYVFGTHGKDGNLVGIQPRLADHLDPDGPDDRFFTPDDGAALSACSPAINAGLAGISDTLMTDLGGQARRFGPRIDIGAYEFQQSPNPTLYTVHVRANATAGGDGRSWSTAFADPYAAFCLPCTDTVRIAAGVYKPAQKDTDSTFMIRNPLTVLGGYPANGSGPREPWKNAAVFSGNIGSPSDSTDNSRNLLVLQMVQDTVVLDGLEFREVKLDAASPAGLVPAYPSGAVVVLNNPVEIRNSRFLQNKGRYVPGSALHIRSTHTVISGSLFADNSAWQGGALRYEGGGLRITRSVFENNAAQLEGGAVYTTAGGIVSHSVFYRNHTTTFGLGTGGAMVLTSGKVYNCTFLGNRTQYYLRTQPVLYGAFDRPGGPEVFNNLFRDNGENSGSEIDWWQEWYSPPVRSNAFEQSFRGNLSIRQHRFVDEANPRGPDGIWMTEDDGLQLRFHAPVVNKGLTAELPAGETDITGRPAVFGGVVDMGAYEYQGTPEARAGKDTLVCISSPVQIGEEGNPAHTYAWTSQPAGFTSAEQRPVVQPSVNTKYYLAVTNGKGAVARDTVEVNVAASLQPDIHIVTGKTKVCAGGGAEFQAVTQNGGDQPAYQWLVNGLPAGTGSATFATGELDSSIRVSAILTSSASCAAGRTDTSNIVTLTVHPIVTPSVTIEQLGPSVCAGTQVTLIARTENVGPEPLFTWYRDGADIMVRNDTLTFEATPFHDNSIYRLQVTNLLCASPGTITSDLLQLRVTPSVQPTATIMASATSICPGAQVTFSATGTHTGNTPVWQWKRNGIPEGTNAPNFSTRSLNDGDTVTVELTSSAACAVPNPATSNALPVTVRSGAPARVTAAASATEICSGTSVTFTASAANAGNGAVYQWRKNGTTVGGNNIVYTSTSLSNGDVVSVRLIRTTACGNDTATSEGISMKVNPSGTPAITLKGTTWMTQGVTTTITAETQWAGSQPVFQWQDSTEGHGWQDIAGAAGSSLVYQPLATGDRLRCRLTSNAPCTTTPVVTSNVLTFNLNPTAIPAVPSASYGIRAFPNPAHSVLEITNLGLQDRWESLEVMTLDGKRTLRSVDLRNRTRITLAVEQLGAGMYLVVMRGWDGRLAYFTFIRL